MLFHKQKLIVDVLLLVIPIFLSRYIIIIIILGGLTTGGHSLLLGISRSGDLLKCGDSWRAILPRVIMVRVRGGWFTTDDEVVLMVASVEGGWHA